jgi:hypothetical protein
MAGARDNVSSTPAIADPPNIELIPANRPKSERPSIPMNTAIADLPLNTHSNYEQTEAVQVVWSRKRAPAFLGSSFSDDRVQHWRFLSST